MLKTITNLCINGKRKKGLWELAGLDEVVRLGGASVTTLVIID